MAITDIDADAAAIADFYRELREGYGNAHTATNAPERAWTVEDAINCAYDHDRYAAAGIRFNRP